MPFPALSKPLRSVRDFVLLPARARREYWRDRKGRLGPDPGPEVALRAAVTWLGTAQDHSATRDGGVARHYSLVSGWGASYPETTGYIIPTLLTVSIRSGESEPSDRARRMLDWLVSIQLDGGGFQGGTVDALPVVPVTFNTGQILMGLSAGVETWGDVYREPMRRAADWLVDTQDPDGCWRKHRTPFAAGGDKSYETHVAWGLLEAARREPGRGYAESARRNIAWALTRQHENGWFDSCCLHNPVKPLTHTLGYALRGVLEGHRFFGEAALLASARLTADALLQCQREDGSIPGRLDAAWQPAVRWVCLTGVVQIAACWFYLYQVTGERRYLDAARSATAYVRRTMSIQGPPEIMGAVKGSFPVSGAYGRFEYLNWAAKFLADACLLELAAGRPDGVTPQGRTAGGP